MQTSTIALIERKRDGGELSAAEVHEFITAYMANSVGEEQMAAFLMAGVVRGFSADEAIALTEALVASGETISLDGLRGPTVDKHSTGGVGDSTTLVVAPILAACGLQVVKLSGRGLGHTGGTLDKLEAIPGFRTDLTPDEVQSQADRIGLAVAAATARLVPADKRLYALRDVTATVPSVALIASSVMSKKLAGGAQHIILDVKVGDGAFIREISVAVELAELCVAIGRAQGRQTQALVTDMSQPLGNSVGNALDVAEAIGVLQGHDGGRFGELSRHLSATALASTGVDYEDAFAQVESAISSGRALSSFRELVRAQGGDPAVADTPWSILPAASIIQEWKGLTGVVSSVPCRDLGLLAASLGAGRQRLGDPIDPAVGIELLVRRGDEVDVDTPIARIHAQTQDEADRVQLQLAGMVTVTSALDEHDASPVPLIHRRIGARAH